MVTYCTTWSQPKNNKILQAKLNTLTGEAIIKLLQLDVVEYGRVNTSIGTKSTIGLAITIARIINEHDFAKSIVKGKS